MTGNKPNSSKASSAKRQSTNPVFERDYFALAANLRVNIQASSCRPFTLRLPLPRYSSNAFEYSQLVPNAFFHDLKSDFFIREHRRHHSCRIEDFARQHAEYTSEKVFSAPKVARRFSFHRNDQSPLKSRVLNETTIILWRNKTRFAGFVAKDYTRRRPQNLTKVNLAATGFKAATLMLQRRLAR